MFMATAILALVLGGAFFMFGAGKLAGAKPMVEAQVHLGLPAGLFKMVGALEVLGAIGVVVGLYKDLPLIGVLAAIGLVGMTIGAAFYHQKVGDAMKDWLPAVLMGSIAIVYIILRVATA